MFYQDSTTQNKVIVKCQSAAIILRYYKMKFKRDIFKDLSELELSFLKSALVFEFEEVI